MCTYKPAVTFITVENYAFYANGVKSPWKKNPLCYKWRLISTNEIVVIYACNCSDSLAVGTKLKNLWKGL